ncbi:MAG: M20 family metallopeptidase [Thermonemataceae bacterium]
MEVRRDIYTNPELAGNEVRTQRIIKQYLLDLGLEVETGTYGNSVVGILNTGKAGKKIAWRAEMDALPNDFPDSSPFKSVVDGVQHGCGHDVHMAIGLGIAEVLTKHKEYLTGSVYFIFQPEEETFIGAKSMVEAGLFSKIDPEEIYTLHITPLPVGKIMVKPNALYAHQKRVKITLKNNLTEAEATALYDDIRRQVSRFEPESKPWEIQGIVDPEIGLHNPSTIFKDYLFMDENAVIQEDSEGLHIQAYLYETNRANLSTILSKIERIIKKTEHGDKLLALSYSQGYPTIMNDTQLTNKSINTLKEIYGKDLMLPNYGQVPYFNDDFCYFQQNVPGVYFFLGGSNFEKGMIAMNHAPNFRVDEEAIKIGVRSFSSLIVERLKDD